MSRRPLPIAPFDRPTICIAGGPSLTLAQVRRIGMAHAAGKVNVIAVNDAVYPCWFADIAYASDETWWEQHYGVPGFRGLKVCMGEPMEEWATGVRTIKCAGTDGFSDDPMAITSGGNSGHAAVHLAATLGAKKIILVAYDFTGDQNGCVVDHWFGRHEGEMFKDNPRHEESRLRAFGTLTDALRDRGVEVINASGRSKITWLPRMDIEQAIAAPVS